MIGSAWVLPMPAPVPATDAQEAVPPHDPDSGGAGPADPPAPMFQRKEAILAAACEQFGLHGFRGASLREIARAAGVSLTLLNHHFDNKAGLLAAVIAEQRAPLRRRAFEIHRLRNASARLFQPADLVHAWAALVFEAAASEAGRRSLQLLARMAGDGSQEAAALRASLEEGTEAFVDALLHCYPAASRRAAVSAHLCMNASLVGVATNAALRQRAMDAGQAWMSSCDRARLERFLVAGIDAALSQPEPAVDAVQTTLRADNVVNMVHS